MRRTRLCQLKEEKKEDEMKEEEAEAEEMAVASFADS